MPRNKFLTTAIALGSVLAIGAATFGPGAQAQSPAARPLPGPAVSAPSAAAATPVPDYTEDDARAILNARIAALRTVISMTAEQEKLWPPVEAALRDIAANALKRGQARGTTAPPVDFLEALTDIANAEETRARDLRNLVNATRPLVAALSDAQRRRIPAFLGMTEMPNANQQSAQLWIFEEEEN